MFLDIVDILRSSQDLEKLVVREEVESRKVLSLFFKIVFKGLLDLFHG
jgi:hypothetical protein